MSRRAQSSRRPAPGINRATTINVLAKIGMQNCGFPKKIRVKKESEFDQIIRNGFKKSGANLVLYRLCSSDQGQKFGIKISRGIKGAVKRNKIKRIIREILRKNKEKFGPREEVVVVFRSKGKATDFDGLKDELENLIK